MRSRARVHLTPLGVGCLLALPGCITVELRDLRDIHGSLHTTEGAPDAAAEGGSCSCPCAGASEHEHSAP